MVNITGWLQYTLYAVYAFQGITCVRWLIIFSSSAGPVACVNNLILACLGESASPVGVCDSDIINSVRFKLSLSDVYNIHLDRIHLELIQHSQKLLVVVRFTVEPHN